MAQLKPNGFTLKAIGLVTACILAGCGAEDPKTSSDTTSGATSCGTGALQPHLVQGDDWRSPMLGELVMVQGMVTRIDPKGLYIESTVPDDNPRTSEGLFLADTKSFGKRFNGEVISASGVVAELGETRDTQTALININDLAPCSDGVARAETPTKLPLNARAREARENMRISLSNRSMVTDVYRLRDGVFRIAGGHPLPIPTEVSRPGKEAERQRKLNGDNNLYVQLAEGDDAVFPIGTELVSDTGVLGHDGKGPRLLLEEPARLMEPPAPVINAPRNGYLRVVSLNLQNYFNGDGRGNGFPTPRGAESPRDFEQQRKRFRAVLKLMQPHIVGVMELENDGFGRGSAALDFLADLEAATGERWEVARPRQQRIGTDEIAVGIFYQPEVITAVGPAQLLDAAPFDLLNRVPVNQLFEHPGSGQRFWLSVNHFKSKGGCPDQGRDRDQRDGQGCWNSARLQAAKALRPWLMQQATATAEGRALVMGDLNAYRIEDPVQHFLSERWSDLTAAPVERHNFSYSYRGETGTLDHALATQPMVNLVAQAGILHINSPYPPGMRLKADHLRSSDHDPVLVDLRFIQSSTSN